MLGISHPRATDYTQFKSTPPENRGQEMQHQYLQAVESDLAQVPQFVACGPGFFGVGG